MHQGGSGEVESRGSVIQSSQQRATHIVPRSSHQQPMMATSQPAAFVSHQSSNNLPFNQHSNGQQPVRRGRDGMERLRPSLAGSRQLVELLQPSRGSRASQRPMKNVNLRQKTGTASNQQLKQEAGVGHSLDQQQHPLMRGAISSLPLVPPPPPGSLPQPTFTIGSSSALVPEDSKLSSAEQKRRGTIKNGFEFLRALVPSLSQTPNVKISKAALLTKGAEYVLQLKEEKANLNKTVQALRSEAEQLSQEIAEFQAQLPTAGSAKGAVGTSPSRLQELFDHHTTACTMQNWKYWVFSRIMQPLLETYDRTVSSASIEDLGRTAGSWLDQHVSLVQLRPLVLNSLKELSVTTEVLSEPHKMPQEALNAVSVPGPSGFQPRRGVGERREPC